MVNDAEKPENEVSEAICDAEVAYQVYYESKYYQYIAKFECQLENSKCCSKTPKMKKHSKYIYSNGNPD